MKNTVDPARDLLIERVVDVPVETMWDAWTIPDLVMQWFTPAPYTTASCKIDLRPGGRFDTVMQSPTGQLQHNIGCYLEIEPQSHIIWTTLLSRDFRPNQHADELYFTARIGFEDIGGDCLYTAHVMHATPDQQRRHEALGFYNGWSSALDQLVSIFSKPKGI